MATFSQRRVERLKKLLITSATRSELAEIQTFLQHHDPKTSNGIGFLDLPPEIRNQIYHYVAKEAHAAVSAVLTSPYRYDDEKKACAMQDLKGAKIRPAILGTCRQMFMEFHSVFYSPYFIKARIWKNDIAEVVTSSALLDAIVNEKHGVARIYICDGVELEKLAAVYSTFKNTFFMAQDLSHGLRSLACTLPNRRPPWIDSLRNDGCGERLMHDCRTQATAEWKVNKASRCALCMISMVPEFAQERK